MLDSSESCTIPDFEISLTVRERERFIRDDYSPWTALDDVRVSTRQCMIT